MTTTQELLESSFELNLSNYGPDDVERLNDWAIKAYAALEALQAEVARLAEIEKQEPVAEMTLVDMGIGDARQLRVNWLMDGYLDVGVKLYAAAGASPVEPSQAPQGCACRWDAEDNRIATCTRHQGWLDVVQEWADRAKAAEAKLAQPPAPSDTAITYMTGYSDGREWAGATNQAQPSQAQPERAEDSVNAKRYLWLRDEAYSVGGKTPFIVIGRDDSNCYAVSGTTTDEAIDAAIKQGGQHD